MMSTFVCLSVCLSVREHISGATRAIFAKFFVHVAYAHGLVLLWQGDKIPRGRGSFGGPCIVTRSLKTGSFHIGREGGDGSAQRVRSVICDCLDIKMELSKK